MKLSSFGQKILQPSGIKQLMADLSEALSVNKDMLMLGGGNPAHIPQMEDFFRESMREILAQKGVFESCIGDYDSPQGNAPFLEALACLLKKEFGWNISAKNIALTNGSQSAFFALFNMFAGPCGEGQHKKILFPLAPEYIGYSDVSLSADNDLFTAVKPTIEHIDEHLFKYHVNFDQVAIGDDIGAVCVSRPTNPTGNVLTDSEIQTLSDITKKAGVPLIIDNAYGTPFPNIIFTEAHPFWDEHIIVCMSLSKLGLPGTRTGIVIANTEIIEGISGISAVMNLAPGSMGATLACEMVRTGRIIELSRDVIMPFYRNKAQKALAQLHKELNGVNYHVHKSEGSLFLWLWLEGLPITCQQLYERLKKRGVLVVPGNYFYPGLQEPWPHTNECIRITYSQDEKIVTQGLTIIADEVKKTYASQPKVLAL